MRKEYWTNFWKEYGKTASDKDEQTQVLRTYNKKPIDPELWAFTLDFIEDKLKIKSEDKLLDLCCGNGLISVHFAQSCRHVSAVDISDDLVKKIDLTKYPNIKPIIKDIRLVDFEDEAFSKVLIYAGIQYLSYGETVDLFEKVYRWLKPGGLFFLGDIPDRAKLWMFFDNEEREAIHFTCEKEGKAIVGTWFEQDWLLKLARFARFSKATIVSQPEQMIYAKFRYDMLVKK